jgi:hypothetical protein
VVAPAAQVADFAVTSETPAQRDEPIIQPGHIELSAPEEPAAALDRPQTMPIADFAAAAEMFNRESVLGDPKPAAEQS